jgi:hypothetical protein
VSHIFIFLKIGKYINSGCKIRSETSFNITLLIGWAYLTACNVGPYHFAVHVAISAKDFLAELIAALKMELNL